MWLACYTQEEIAETEDISREAISDKIAKFGNFGNLAKNCKTHAEYFDDFEPPIYISEMDTKGVSSTYTLARSVVDSIPQN